MFGFKIIRKKKLEELKMEIRILKTRIRIFEEGKK